MNLSPRSHAPRGNALVATLRVARPDAERREQAGSHAERGNQNRVEGQKEMNGALAIDDLHVNVGEKPILKGEGRNAQGTRLGMPSERPYWRASSGGVRR